MLFAAVSRPIHFMSPMVTLMCPIITNVAPWWAVPMVASTHVMVQQQWAQFRKTINLCVGTKDIQAAKEEVSKHVPVPINVHHFPIHITQDCRTQSWKLFFLYCFLKVFSHSRLCVHHVLRARGVIMFTAGRPHESYHRRESLGSWTRVDCTETRKIKMSDS